MLVLKLPTVLERGMGMKYLLPRLILPMLWEYLAQELLQLRILKEIFIIPFKLVHNVGQKRILGLANIEMDRLFL